MNRLHCSETAYSDESSQNLIKQTAFHEAGHAAAIYLYNKQKKLPSIFFQISTKELCSNKIIRKEATPLYNKSFVAKIEGGRLIQSLPVSVLENKRQSPATTGQCALQTAYEADIINLLAGPISEAKYVNLRDGEEFSPLLLNISALKFYGGESDLSCINEYLDYFLDNPQEREQKLSDLFKKAFDFVDNKPNWKAIASLANYILNNQNQVISCKTAFTILDNSFSLLAQVIDKQK